MTQDVTETEGPFAEAAEDVLEEAAELPSRRATVSPYDLPGGWYVIHSYSGYENKVKANLETRIKSMHLEDKVFDVSFRWKRVVEFKTGRKVNVSGRSSRATSWCASTWTTTPGTPCATRRASPGLSGPAPKPTPLSRREVERILGVRKDEEEKKEPRFKPAWEVGETVRVVEGPFADFNGVIEDINVDQSKVRVLVDIFGRETPVELNFDQIVKF